MSTPQSKMSTPTEFLKYDASLETIKPNEQQVFDEVAAITRAISAKVGDQFRHTMRPLHAKSHGLLKAELTVHDGLPEPYRQGLFSKSTAYPAIIRLSTIPGDILPDSVSTPRGWAMKLVGVEGFEMLPGHEGQVTQDFVFVNGPVFGAPNTEEFLKVLKLLEQHATDSAALKQVVSTTTRAFENALELVSGGSDALKNFGHPETHILGETFYSQAALRYGGYVAKISIAPLSENLKALTNKHINHSKFSALRDAVADFFKTETAEWEIRAQLLTDLKRMPVEDPTVKWPEEESPYVAVGTIVAKPQNAYSGERRIFVDEQLSFNPWHGIAAHQPLGNVMRARKTVYPATVHYRHGQEQRTGVEPKSIDELPA
jgi:catalase